MIWMRPTQLDQPMAAWPNSGPPGLPENLRGPQKGLSGPKRALLGAPGVLLRSLEGPEHMVWMRPTQLDRPMVVWPKSGPLGLPEVLWGPQKGLSGPKRALLGAPGVP